jgi:poly-gamma-glutamate synthesis protein (capsule biosynthesis protein)
MLSYNSDKNIRLIFVGDIMLSNILSNNRPEIYNGLFTPGKLIKYYNIDVFKNFSKLFNSADIVIVNLECFITTHKIPTPNKSFTFRANPRVLPLLKKYFSALSIANNHSYDFDEIGFNQMLNLLKNNNIPYFGGGYTIHEAIQPLIFNVKNKKIAILGFDNSISNYGDAIINKSGKISALELNLDKNMDLSWKIHIANLDNNGIPYYGGLL